MVRDLNDKTLAAAVALKGVDPSLDLRSVDGATFVRLCHLFEVPPARRRIFEYEDGSSIAVYDTRAGGVEVHWQCNEREVADALAAVERAEATP